MIIGRQRELIALNRTYTSKKAEFIAVYGRRRVGKTFLIRNFCTRQDGLTFQITGIRNAPLKTQLSEFTKELEAFYAKLGIQLQLKQPTTWLQAFEMLTEATKQTKRKIILFFDEFPWLATKKSKVLQALDYYWNRYWTDCPHIKLIICGSAASWIINNVLNNKGGLHNRVTLRLLIEPFTLSETQAYLKSQHIALNQAQILQLYMCIGGIPFYLSCVQNGLSATQNINDLCFQKQGALAEEFQNLFSSLFQTADKHETIVKLLATRRYGMSRKDIETATAYKGGGLTRILQELEYAGFIQSFNTDGKARATYYKLVDEYTLFYLHWIAPPAKQNRLKEINTTFWEAASQSAAWKAWSGYAFEAICFKHLSNIKKALKIPESAVASTWRYLPSKNTATHGAQIDLLFDRPDGVITLCEIKYASHPFTVDKTTATALKHKMTTYQKITKTHKHVVISMITANGLKSSAYLEGLVWSSAMGKDLFE